MKICLMIGADLIVPDNLTKTLLTKREVLEVNPESQKIVPHGLTLYKVIVK